jgi:histidinol phosphatase-like PHP family hydrolase
MNGTLGAQWHAVDSHVHTPASPDYKDPQAEPADIVAAATAAGLQAIVVSDHNTLSWIEPMRQAAGTDLVVFPGVEINTQGGHLLAVFDPRADLDDLETALINAGIDKRDWGKPDVVGHSFQEAMAAVVGKGGLAIAAHADGPVGFLQTNLQGPVKQEIYADPNLSALEIIDLTRKDDYVHGRLSGYSRHLACVQGSDAHSVGDVGSRMTLLSMHHLSLDGLRYALDEPLLRIRFPHEWVPVEHPHIESLTVSQGFLGAHAFTFNPGLSCLVGGAGSGKSTVIEFLRFALDQVCSLKSIADDCRGKLQDLACPGAAIEVMIVTDAGEKLVVTREYDGYDNPIVVKRQEDGIVLEGVDVRGLFPVHAYSQGEVISISRSPVAQMALIDKHLKTDIAHYQEEIEQAYEELRRQIEGLVKLEAVVAGRAQVQTQFATTQAAITARNSELCQLTVAQHKPTVTSHNLWVAELNFLTDLVNSFRTARGDIQRSMDDIVLAPLLVSPLTDATPNRDAVDECVVIATELSTARTVARDALLVTLDNIEARVRERAAAWKEKWEAHKADYEACQAEAGMERIATINAELERLRKQEQQARSELSRVEAAQERLDIQMRKRQELLELIADRKARIHTLRDAKRKSIVAKLGTRIALKLIPDGHRSEYTRMMTDLMRGSYTKAATIEQVCLAIHPLELAEYLRTENATAISETAGVPSATAEAFIEQATAVG